MPELGVLGACPPRKILIDAKIPQFRAGNLLSLHYSKD